MDVRFRCWCYRRSYKGITLGHRIRKLAAGTKISLKIQIREMEKERGERREEIGKGNGEGERDADGDGLE